MSVLIASWIGDFATEYWRAVAILKFVIISQHRDGRVHHMNVLGLKLPLLSVCYFHPDFSISSPWIPVYHLLLRPVGFKLWSLSDSQKSLLKCIFPSPPPRFWSGRLGNLCCWLVPQRLGEAGFLLKRTHWGRGALWSTRLQTLRMMASSYWVSTLCFFASGFPSSPTHLK